MDGRTEAEKIADPRDWRGTKIEIGSPVIYGAPLGRSIQLVEGEVVGFSKTGRVNVRIVRRAVSHAWGGNREVVHVGQDRLIVIRPDSLPPTGLPTWGDKLQEANERLRVYRETGEFPPRVLT